MKKRLFPLLLVCLFLFSSCAWTERTPMSVLSALIEAEAALPNGRCYHLSAAAEEERPSERFLATVFGKEVLPTAFAGVEDAAFFFSYRNATELDLFYCRSVRDAAAVAAMCHQRLDTLRMLWAHDENAISLLENAELLQHGRWVLLAVAENADDLRRHFLRLT